MSGDRLDYRRAVLNYDPTFYPSQTSPPDDRTELQRLHQRARSALECARIEQARFHAALLEQSTAGRTVRDLAAELGISHQRIHQILKQARADE